MISWAHLVVVAAITGTPFALSPAGVETTLPDTVAAAGQHGARLDKAPAETGLSGDRTSLEKKISKIGITYTLYQTKRGLHVGTYRQEEASAAMRSHLKPDEKLFLIVHGLRSNSTMDWVLFIKDEILALEREGTSVIAVDWSRGCSKLLKYFQAAENVRYVGAAIGMVIQDLAIVRLVNLCYVHFIGHSLGAHVGGFFGRYIALTTSRRIGRITGLDPAGPNFHMSNDHLSDKDAMFVDVIHTNAGIHRLGIAFSIGHADFYPNGGRTQPGCDSKSAEDESIESKFTKSCDHSRAVLYYAKSVGRHRYTATPCYDWDAFKAGKCPACTGDACERMGHWATPYARGNYYLEILPQSPHFDAACSMSPSAALLCTLLLSFVLRSNV